MSSPKRRIALVILAAASAFVATGLKADAQPRSGQSDDELVRVQNQRGGVRTVTIPITIRQKGQRASQQELMPVGVWQRIWFCLESHYQSLLFSNRLEPPRSRRHTLIRH